MDLRFSVHLGKLLQQNLAITSCIMTCDIHADSVSLHYSCMAIKSRLVS